MDTTTNATRWYVKLEHEPSNGLLLDFNVALNVITDLRQITLHALGILVVDNLKEFFQLCSNLSYLVVGIGVEEDFLKQIVVLVEHTLGYTHVALEGGTRCILMLHDSSEHEGRHKGDTQRVSHRLVVLLEGVLIDVQAQLLIEILEEDTSHVVTLADDDGVLFRELLQVGKRRTKHRVSRYIAHARTLIELLQISLHRGDITDDALLGQIGNHLFEHRDSIFQRDSIDEQLGLKLLDLLVGGKALTIIGKAHALRIAFEDSHLVVETQQVDEEASHLSCSHY